MLSVAAFDLETSNLNADYGVLGAGVIIEGGSDEPIVFRADQTNRRWKNKRSDDSAIVRAVIERLSTYDVLVAHNGANFDIPFLNSRAARWKIPGLPRKKLIDPVRIARWQFRLSGNSLASISKHLGLEPKMDLPSSVWVEAFLDGDRAAMDLIVERCVSDVRILVDVVKAVKGFCHQLDHRGSSW